METLAAEFLIAVTDLAQIFEHRHIGCNARGCLREDSRAGLAFELAWRDPEVAEFVLNIDINCPLDS